MSEPSDCDCCSYQPTEFTCEISGCDCFPCVAGPEDLVVEISDGVNTIRRQATVEEYAAFMRQMHAPLN